MSDTGNFIDTKSVVMENMFTQLNNQDRLLIVLHEIYGIDKHIRTVCDYYSKQGFDIICPNLLGRETPFPYDQQEEAYAYFMRGKGFDAASLEVKKLIREMKHSYRSIFLLGFSIGATIAWICSEGNTECDGIIGYYGSRIRDYLDIHPYPPVLLIYGDQEGFGLEKLLKGLETKDKVSISLLPGKHDFANPYAENYCEQSYRIALEKAADFLKTQSAKPLF